MKKTRVWILALYSLGLVAQAQAEFRATMNPHCVRAPRKPVKVTPMHGTVKPGDRIVLANGQSVVYTGKPGVRAPDPVSKPSSPASSQPTPKDRLDLPKIFPPQATVPRPTALAARPGPRPGRLDEQRSDANWVPLAALGAFLAVDLLSSVLQAADEAVPCEARAVEENGDLALIHDRAVQRALSEAAAQRSWAADPRLRAAGYSR